MTAPTKITLDRWDARYRELQAAGLVEPSYGGPLRRHLDDGDLRLADLEYDNSPAALRLWNFLLSEEDRLAAVRADGGKLVGAMKDLGTVPVMAYALPDVTAFYPDGAWWIPCVMQLSSGQLRIADAMGVDDSFCPVRAMLGAFVTEAHFPRPDLLICSAGAVCDDFSAIAQRLAGLGEAILWWEVPLRRSPAPGEEAVELPGGFVTSRELIGIVAEQLEELRRALGRLAGRELDDALLAESVSQANRIRRALRELRRLAYTATPCPLPALEMLIAEMLAIHYCSDRAESLAVLEDLLAEVRGRIEAGQGVLPAEAVRVYWVNPVADLRAMNLLEQCGGRVCGTEYLFAHALDDIPEDIPPIEALAQMALADPMVGPAADRADRVCREAEEFGAEAVLVSRIPGASHCATEGEVIADVVQSRLGIPVGEIEVPPLSDSMRANLSTRIQALLESARSRRKP